MGNRQLAVVVGVLVAIAVVALAGRAITFQSESVIISDVPELTETSLDRVVIRNNEFETVVDKVGGEWRVGQYPVVRNRFEDMWATTAMFQKAELIARNPENHSIMGVAAENGTFVEFWKDDELVDEFFIGDQQFARIGERMITRWTVFVRTCFLRRPDSDDVFGIFCDFPDRFPTDPKFWRNPIIAEIPRDEIQVVRFRYSDEEFELELNNSVWTLTGGQFNKEPADSQVMVELLQYLEMLVASDFPTEDEVSRLDFSIADITLELDVRPGSTSRSARVLFMRRDEGGFFVKRSDQAYAYILEDDLAIHVLKKIADFVVEVDVPSPTQ